MTITRHFMRIVGAVLVEAMIAVPTVRAQTSQQDDWQQGTALSLFAGGATASDTGTAVGAALAWEFTPRLTIEGSGIWADGSKGSSSFGAFVGPRVNLLPRRTVVPFAAAGIGLFRASLGADINDVPGFCRRRMMAGTGLLSQREFTDLAFAVGAGMDIFLHRHIALRPDVRVLLVTADSSVRPVTFVGVHLSYHFESHNVTPATAARVLR